MVLFTVRVKVSEILAALPSVAVTLMSIVPTSPLAGVPLKLRVAPSKPSHPGRALLSANVAP